MANEIISSQRIMNWKRGNIINDQGLAGKPDLAPCWNRGSQSLQFLWNWLNACNFNPFSIITAKETFQFYFALPDR